MCKGYYIYRIFFLYITFILSFVGCSKSLPFDVTVYDNYGLSLLSFSSINEERKSNVHTHAVRQCRFRNNYKKKCRQVLEEAINGIVDFRPRVIESLISWEQMRNLRTINDQGGNVNNLNEEFDNTNEYMRDGVIDIELLFEGLGVETVQLPLPQCSLDQNELVESATSHCLRRGHSISFKDGGCLRHYVDTINKLWMNRDVRRNAQVYGSEVPLIEFMVSAYPSHSNETSSNNSIFHLYISQNCIWDVNDKNMEISLNRAAQYLVLKHSHAFDIEWKSDDSEMVSGMSGHWLYETIRSVIVDNLPHNEHNIPSSDSSGYNIKYGCESQRHHISCQLPSSSNSACSCIRFVTVCAPPPPFIVMKNASMKRHETIKRHRGVLADHDRSVEYVMSYVKSVQRGSTVDSLVYKGSCSDLEDPLHFIAKFTAPGYRGLGSDSHWLRHGPLIAEHEYSMLARLQELTPSTCVECFARPYAFWGNVSSHILSAASGSGRVLERSLESVSVDSDEHASWSGYLSEDIGRGRGVSTLGQVARCGWESDLSDALVTVFRLFDILQSLQEAGISHNDFLPHNIVIPRHPEEVSDWMCEDNAAMGGHQWRVIDFGYSSLIGVAKAGGFPHYLGLSKGIDGRPPNFEIEGRDDIYSLGQSLASIMPLKSMLLTGIVAEMTMSSRAERANQVSLLSRKAQRLTSIGKELLHHQSPSTVSSELHLCVLWEPALVGSLYERLRVNLPHLRGRTGVSLRALHLHPAITDDDERVRTTTAFYASSLLENGFAFGSRQFRVDDERAKRDFVVVFLDAQRASSDSGTWDELVALKSDLRLEIDNLNIQHVNGYNSLHCTEAVEETVENLVALGYSIETVEETAWKLPSARPRFSDVEQVFAALNKGPTGESVVFVILRNWERPLTHFDSDGEDDVDLLVDNLELAVELIGGLPGADPHHMANSKKTHGRVSYLVSVNNIEMKFDLRFVGDEYYPEDWAKQLLLSREPIPGITGGWRASALDHFFSLMYHASIHKEMYDMRGKHVQLCQMLQSPKQSLPSWQLKEYYCDGMIGDEGKRLKILSCFMKQRGYRVVQRPHDPSTGYFEPFATALAVAVNRHEGDVCFTEFGHINIALVSHNTLGFDRGTL